MRFTTSLVDKFASRMVEIPDQRCCFCLPWWHTQTFPATENNQVFKQFVSSSSALSNSTFSENGRLLTKLLLHTMAIRQLKLRLKMEKNVSPRWRFWLDPFVSKQSIKYRHLAMKIENELRPSSHFDTLWSIVVEMYLLNAKKDAVLENFLKMML